MHVLQEIINPNMRHNTMNKYERKGDGKVIVMHNDKDQVEIPEGANKGTWIRSDKRIIIPAGIDLSKVAAAGPAKPATPVVTPVTPVVKK